MTTFEIIAFALLLVPTGWEVFDDRHGDLNKSEDVIWRVATGLVVALIASKLNLIRFIIAFNLSMAMHFLLFDYLIAYVLIKNGTLEPPRGVTYRWWTYVAKAGFVDNVPWWKRLNWSVKLGIRVVYFGISLILYFI